MATINEVMETLMDKIPESEYWKYAIDYPSDAIYITALKIGKVDAERLTNTLPEEYSWYVSGYQPAHCWHRIVIHKVK